MAIQKDRAIHSAIQSDKTSTIENDQGDRADDPYGARARQARNQGDQVDKLAIQSAIQNAKSTFIEDVQIDDELAIQKDKAESTDEPLGARAIQPATQNENDKAIQIDDELTIQKESAIKNDKAIQTAIQNDGKTAQDDKLDNSLALKGEENSPRVAVGELLTEKWVEKFEKGHKQNISTRAGSENESTNMTTIENHNLQPVKKTETSA